MKRWGFHEAVVAEDRGWSRQVRTGTKIFCWLVGSFFATVLCPWVALRLEEEL